MIKIDKAYEKVDNETTKSFKLKRDKLNKEEEDLKDKLKLEVTKVKEKLENYLSQVNNLFKSCEKIKKGILSFEKEERNIIEILSYISKINKNQREIDLLKGTLMKNLEIRFNEKQSIIEYNEYIFNGVPLKNKIIREKKEHLEEKNKEEYYEEKNKEEYFEEKNKEEYFEEKNMEEKNKEEN